MYNGIIKFTPRIGKIYPQGVNLPPVENPCSKAYRKPKALNCRWNNFYLSPWVEYLLQTEFYSSTACAQVTKINTHRCYL